MTVVLQPLLRPYQSWIYSYCHSVFHLDIATETYPIQDQHNDAVHHAQSRNARKKHDETHRVLIELEPHGLWVENGANQLSFGSGKTCQETKMPARNGA